MIHEDGFEHVPEVEAAAVAAGLDEVCRLVVAILRTAMDDDARKRAARALRAVISAELTMCAADAFLLAPTPAMRLETFKALRRSCILRVGHEVRRKP